MSADIRHAGLTWDAERLSRRRAVEAIRSGVPNAAAVMALGSGQSDLEDRFAAQLERVAGRRGAGGDRRHPGAPGGAGQRASPGRRVSLISVGGRRQDEEVPAADRSRVTSTTSACAGGRTTWDSTGDAPAAWRAATLARHTGVGAGVLTERP